ncbi:MAG: hypothetical protein KME40_04585 [Komarekiella atlantica HA4396-MV6]|nr:hypothetical protein [Komarekiella atlantica HA4396-MV6]
MPLTRREAAFLGLGVSPTHLSLGPANRQGNITALLGVVAFTERLAKSAISLRVATSHNKPFGRLPDG